MKFNDIRIGIIGLGYVGLPLARLFATKYPVVGFDINSKRISEIIKGIDNTLELSENFLKKVLVNKNPVENSKIGLYCTSDIKDLEKCNYYIITVPTPIDNNNTPDLSPLYRASETVAKVISKNDIVIYESTVYPGATEEECIPIIENISGLKINIDFYAGYSPERINPGDKEHTVEKIKKVTSGSNKETGIKVDKLYSSVIIAGTHLASNIRVAEAAKVIENSQRDINIAFVNELKKIFDKMNIDIREVLEAAKTKWNFLNFTPGLVGGHCIGVDPYYLAQKAQKFGYHPEIILAGRRMNDSMGEYIATEIIKKMIKQNLFIKDSKILILGFTFKENCPDIRNTKVIDIINALKDYGPILTICDPWANISEVRNEYNISLVNSIPAERFDAIILAVPHKEFLEIDINQFVVEQSIVYDLKGAFKKVD